MGRSLILLILLVSPAIFAQVTLGVEPSKRDLVANEPLVLNFFLEIRGDDHVQQSKLRLVDVSNFKLLSSGSEQTSFRDPENGEIVYQILYQYILMPQKTGKIKIGSSSVVIDNKIYYTEPFDINVRPAEVKIAATSTNKDHDVTLSATFEELPLQQDQPNVLLVKASSKNLTSLHRVLNVSLPPSQEFYAEQVAMEKPEIQTNGPTASAVVAKYLVYPKKAGALKIPAVSAQAAGRTIQSKPLQVSTEKIPLAGEAKLNAVGQFRVHYPEDLPTKAELDKPITIAVEISGVGNLKSLTIPELKTSGATVKKFKPDVRYETAVRGDKIGGNIKIKYLIVPKSTGSLAVQVKDFTYYDTDTRKKKVLPGKRWELSVHNHEQLMEMRTTMERVSDYSNVVLKTVNNPVIKTNILEIKERDRINWQAILTNTVLLTIAGFGLAWYRNYRKEKQRLTDTAAQKTAAEATLQQADDTEADLLVRDLTVSFNKQDFQEFFETAEKLYGKLLLLFGVTSLSQARKQIVSKVGAQGYADLAKWELLFKLEKDSPVHDGGTVNKIYHQMLTYLVPLLRR